MKVEEYISSGILEAYVLDELSDRERTEVEKNATTYHEVREELERVELTLESLALATGKRPSENIKNQLLSQIEAPIIPIRKQDAFPVLKLLAAASLTLALVSTIIAYQFWNNWQDAEERFASLAMRNQQIAENYSQVNERLDDLLGAVAVMNSKDFQRVVMNGTDSAPQAQATVYWNKTSQQVFLSIQSLRTLSSDQQYQLWAIIDGKPVDAGTFDLSKDTYLIPMVDVGREVAAFAVTIEPYGGSENPSLETMQVVGNV